MNIAIFTSTFLPRIGGTEVVVHQLARGLIETGHRCTVITWWGVYRELKKDRRFGRNYEISPVLPKSFEAWRVLSRIGLGDFVALIQVLCLQVRHRFDLWHVHMGYPAAPFLVPALKMLKIPHVVTCHGDDIQTLPEIGYGMRLDPKMEKQIGRALRMSDAVTSISASMTEMYRELEVPEDRIHDVPNGVLASRVSQAKVDKAKIRADLNIPPDYKVILTVGRNDRRKGFNYIPDAIQELLRTDQKIVWILVGRGTEVIGQMAKKNGVDQHLIILPNIDVLGENDAEDAALTPATALIRLLRSADLFVFPSLIEGFGVVLIEAMAAGLPTVTTRVPGCRDVIKDGLNGILVQPGDALELAKGVGKLLRDEKLAKNMSVAALTMSEMYEWSRVVVKYCDVYKHVLDHY